MESPEDAERQADEGDELGYRKADEDTAYDERGSQGDDPGEPTEDDAEPA